ncbi:threonine transporter RhtB [Acinetobacter cumulans]|jgi:threonine efflux protein|uniref:Threonine transporter RhtB n=1 Tax=Acinetobacter cumulans TaxID=2136182 RepID=A0A3A8FLS3_9GAMM|nr:MULTISPECIES: LysE family transporter [Acinetobacter]NWK76239.1 LysE family transporter [Acinetobacter sp. SwsAc6]QCO22506.1 threonine transporter RhtB [Acinetobacter cumulans]RFS24441.1 threonine transporter RhtB [Acinetobacter sp. SWAC5]RKG39326.1 threonine transporter RhtB [Acinetobacter cumulans]RKG47915.1 threonine transporter RhtB [Acinetobacter cumulans]
MSLLFTICLLHFVAQLSPGPDVLLIAKSAASTTRANTLKIIAGISVGIVAWVVLTLSGFTVLVEQFPWIQQVLMLVGGLFLAKMGWAMFNGGLKSLKKVASLESDNESEATKNYFMLGLLTNLSNPKTLIYFSSVFSLALSSSAGTGLKTQLAIIIPIQTFLVFSLLMLILSMPKIKSLYQRSGAYIDVISGLLFLGFAIWLWLDALKLV